MDQRWIHGWMMDGSMDWWIKDGWIDGSKMDGLIKDGWMEDIIWMDQRWLDG